MREILRLEVKWVLLNNCQCCDRAIILILAVTVGVKWCPAGVVGDRREVVVGAATRVRVVVRVIAVAKVGAVARVGVVVRVDP